MQHIRSCQIMILLTAGFLSCGAGNPETPARSTLQGSEAKSVITKVVTANPEMDDNLHTADLPNDPALNKQLQPIKANFKRINAITQWSQIITKELMETTEGGVAIFYYSNEKLEKIITKEYGETFQVISEYYLLNGKLSFVFEQSYYYNRPVYQDSAYMEKMGDTEAFDLEKSEIVESRNYFDNGKIIHQIHSEEAVKPITAAYLLKEEQRIRNAFDTYIQLENKK